MLDIRQQRCVRIYLFGVDVMTASLLMSTKDCLSTLMQRCRRRSMPAQPTSQPQGGCSPQLQAAPSILACMPQAVPCLLVLLCIAVVLLAVVALRHSHSLPRLL
jgi:hypothetical protein